MARETKIDSKEYEISIDDVRNVCEDFGCEPDQIIGILLELNLICIRQTEETISTFKGTGDIYVLQTNDFLYIIQNTQFSVILKKTARKPSLFLALLVLYFKNL